MSNYSNLNNPFDEESHDNDLISPVGYPKSPENSTRSPTVNAQRAGKETLFSNDLLVEPLGAGDASSSSGFATNPSFHTSPKVNPSVVGNMSTKPMPGIGPTNVDTFMDTLDEPVITTLKRDLNAIWQKLKQVVLPYGNRTVLKDWDLWGPLLLCLALAIRQSVTASSQQASLAFTGVFVIVWGGSALLTINAKVLGGSISFFQSVCVCGYCIFPLVISSIVTLFVPWIVIRAPIVGVAYFWSVYASSGFLTDTHLENRRALAVYPVFLFYFVITWMILISKSVLG